METGESPITTLPKDRWEYRTYLREYLLLLARKGQNGLESIKNYPNEIEIGPVWHKTFNTIREETKNGNEYWGYIGFKSDMRSLSFPAAPAKGYEGCIPAELIKKETQAARDNFGVVSLLGDIHSHPRDFAFRLDQMLPRPEKNHLYGRFSVGDLYIMADTEQFRPMMALVEGDYNLVVFRTRETNGLPLGSSVFTQKVFQKYWYENNGYEFIGSDRHGEKAIPKSPKANLSVITAKILDKHSLVLYQGYKNCDLKKVVFT